MTVETKLRVGVVAADPLRSLGLETILQEVVGLTPVALSLEGIAGDKKLAALLLDVRTCPNVVTEVVARIRHERSELKIVVVGEVLDPDLIQSVIGAGAKGYLLETADEREIKMAMDVVLDGSVWAPRKVLARLIDASGAGTQQASVDSIAEKLTPREMDVLKLLMEGSTNRQIARAMAIDEVTVKAHLGRMLRKSGSANRVELTLRAMEELGAKGQEDADVGAEGRNAR